VDTAYVSAAFKNITLVLARHNKQAYPIYNRDDSGPP